MPKWWILALGACLALSACTSGSGEQTNADLAQQADLSEFWGCGIGFAASNKEQTVALFVYSADQEPVPPVAFPDGKWEARIVVGKDLLANHCDDVIEEGEPVPVVEEEWVIDGGTLEFVHTDAGLCGGSGPVTGSFTGLTATNSSSSLVIADLEIVNENYGCFAG